MEELKLIRDNYWATKDGRIYSTKRNGKQFEINCKSISAYNTEV